MPDDENLVQAHEETLRDARQTTGNRWIAVILAAATGMDEDKLARHIVRQDGGLRNGVTLKGQKLFPADLR